MDGTWLREKSDDTNIVFIHGINSSDICWKHDNGTYWPELLTESLDSTAKPELSQAGMYVYNYQTNIFSGTYQLDDVVSDLKERLNLDGVFQTKRIIFVCHSMGGIVARRLIVQRRELFKPMQIGLFLIASPSLGSEQANVVSGFATILGFGQAKALQFSQQNTWLNSLDSDFKNLKESGDYSLFGKELVEDKAIILSKFLKASQTVKPFSAARYFGNEYKVPNSDHLSISKVENGEAIQHRLLVKFLDDLPEIESVAEASQGTELSQSINNSVIDINMAGASVGGDVTISGLTVNNHDSPSIPASGNSKKDKPAKKGVSVFYCYAREDAEYRKQLGNHLSILKRQGVIEDWFDGNISAGAEWEQNIRNKLEECDIFLLLVSSDFLASDFIHNVELKRAMERHEAGTTRVIPIIVRACDWTEASFAKLQALPTGAKAVASWDSVDEAFSDVAKGIRHVVETLSQ